MVSDFWTPLYIKYSIIISVVSADPLFLTCLVSLQNPQISLNSLTSALPFLSLSLPPPSIHSDSVCGIWSLLLSSVGLLHWALPCAPLNTPTEMWV